MTFTTIVVVAALAVAILLVLANRGTRRQEAERAEEYRKVASLRGWRMETEGAHVRYSGTTDGIPWTFDGAHHRRQGQVRHPSRWATDAVRSDEVIVVWPRQGQAAQGATLGAVILERVRNAVFGPLAAILGVEASELANAKSDEAMAWELRGEEVVAAVVSPAGMRLVVPTAISSPEEVEKIVRLGLKLARTRNVHPVF
jgi:type II secretory pathway pseudopilin PulG